MAANARARALRAQPLAGMLCLLCFASCGQGDANTAAAGAGGNEAQAPLTQGAVTGKPPAKARKVDRSRSLDTKLVAAILDECHRPLQTRMQHVKVTVTLPDGRRLLVQADLPDRARVHDGTRDFLWVDHEVHRLDDGAATEAVAESEGSRARIQPLARIVDAVAFGPLYRAIACHREGNDFVLTDASGTTTTLQLHDDTLLPRALLYGDETVRFDDYLRTKTTWVVSKVTHAKLGTCATIFEDGGVVFGSDFFKVPNTPQAANPAEAVRMTSPGTVRERESATPLLVAGKAAQWVVLQAGTDWSQRHQIYQSVHELLEAQNQQIFGFPMLWQEQGSQLLGVPFLRRDGGNAFAEPAGWEIRSSPDTRLLVVYPPSGNVAQRIQEGTAQLQRAAANRKLKMIGPIVAQPFIHLHDGAPDSSKLANCKVRVSVRIE